MDEKAITVTPVELEDEITDEHYFTADEAIDYAPGAINTVSTPGEIHPSLRMLTFCVLVLRNGCKVVGVNHGPVDPARFDPEYGRKDAREDAIRQVWPLLGFRLRDRLHRLAEARAIEATIDGDAP